MRALIRLAARLYPPAWRARYGDELQALIEDRPLIWRDVADVAREGITMHIRYSRVTSAAAIGAVVAGLLAGGMAWSQPDRFEATGVLEVRPTSASGNPGALLDGVRSALSAGTLTPIIARHGLGAVPVSEDLLEQVRGRITVQTVDETRIQVSFANHDPGVAQRVTTELVGQLAGIETASLELRLIDTPDLPGQPANGDRVAVAGASGVGGGAMIGALLGLIRRRAKVA